MFTIGRGTDELWTPGGHWQVHISINSSPRSIEVECGRKQRGRWWGRCMALRVIEEPSNLKMGQLDRSFYLLHCRGGGSSTFSRR